jgi:putative ABC transport system permease protein
LVGGLSRLTPVVRMAVTYPTQHRFRTGLTLFMFSLVVFALIVEVTLTGSFSSQSLNLDRDVGGYAVFGSATRPISNIAAQVHGNPALRRRVVGEGGLGQLFTTVSQPGNRRRTQTQVNIADGAFLGSNRFSLHARAYGYTSDRQVWAAVRAHPGYAVVPAALTATSGSTGFSIHGINAGGTSFAPTRIVVKDPRSGKNIPLTVIGVLDPGAASFGDVSGVFTNEGSLIAAGAPPLPLNLYGFQIAPGQDVRAAALAIGSAFLSYGLEVRETKVVYEQNNAVSRGFTDLIAAFMALGLIVGAAALGVIATRAVVERRQQIGLLRALGFRRRMVSASFLIESGFIALVGTALGAVLGLALAHSLVDYLVKGNPLVHFVIPWEQVAGVMALAYVTSLLTTYFPAWQASRVYPAEALRYE